MQSSGLSKLMVLASQDCFVFHGSGLRLEQLEPRQAFTLVQHTRVPDGLPAIFASDDIDYAIFMALVNAQTCPDGLRASCNYVDGMPVFAASKNTLDQLDSATRGFVHVFNRTEFVCRGGREWISTSLRIPLQIVEVVRSDFRNEIVVMSEKI